MAENFVAAIAKSRYPAGKGASSIPDIPKTISEVGYICEIKLMKYSGRVPAAEASPIQKVLILGKNPESSLSFSLPREAYVACASRTYKN